MKQAIKCPSCGHNHYINPAALLGSKTSAKKAEACRRNGKLGGHFSKFVKQVTA